MTDTQPPVSRPARRRPLATLLVERGIFATQDEARRWIMAGQVLVDGRRVDKPGTLVPRDAALRVRGRHRYVSRGGYKLEAALDHFGVPVAGRVALDCGASTGGFTDCLLQRGAALVYAVEVGYGQLAGSLRIDPRVRSMERTNLGDVVPGTLDPPPTLVTLDLSYLSLTAAVPIAASLLGPPPGDILALLKPLFEVEDPAAGRTGRVDDPALLVAALQRVLAAGTSAGLTPLGAARLALRPRHGVVEFVVHFGRDTGRPPWDCDSAALAQIVAGPGIGKVEAEDQHHGDTYRQTETPLTRQAHVVNTQLTRPSHAIFTPGLLHLRTVKAWASTETVMTLQSYLPYHGAVRKRSPGGGAMCSGPLVDVLVPVHHLRTVLEALRQKGQTEITFEGLRNSCREALETGDGATGAIPTEQGAVPELSSAATAVAAARIVYHYVKRNHLWSVTKDRRDRLYYVSSVLETLDWIQSQVVLAETEGAAV